jgi:hypothetical protein
MTMLRPILVLVTLVAVGLSGCLAEEDNSSQGQEEAKTAFKEQNAKLVDGVLQVGEANIEGRILYNGSAGPWAASPNLVLEVPKIVLTKTDPGTLGGGGTSKVLMTPTDNISLEVRLTKRDQLKNLSVRWAIEPFSLSNMFNIMPRDSSGGKGGGGAPPEATCPTTLTWSESRPASETSTLAVERAGRFAVYAMVEASGKSVALLCVPLIGWVGHHIVVESAVRPVGARAAVATSPGYDAMADVFALKASDEMASVEARTIYRGTWSASSGHDVDLEVKIPSGSYTQMYCKRSTPASTAPETHSTEEVMGFSSAAAANLTIRVGALSPDCGTSANVYVNAGMVPYTLDIRLTYPIEFGGIVIMK